MARSCSSTSKNNAVINSTVDIRLSSQRLTITHNFRELRERPKGQIVDNKKGAADNKL
jgi:hypothetical protein